MLPERSHCRPHTRKRPPSQTIRAPVVAVRWVTQAITARATSSGSTTRLSGVTAAIFSSAVRSRPATKSVATALGPHQVFVLRPYFARPEPDRAGLPQAQAPVAKSQRIGSATHTASGFHRESRVGKFPLGLGFGARLLVALFSILAGSRVLDAIVSTIMLTLVASLIVWAVL